MTDSLKAFAKVNLYLRVLNRRDDGYHNILSLMATAGLHDLLKLEKIELRPEREGTPEIIVRITGGRYYKEARSVSGRENLITKAALKYLHSAGLSGSMHFSLEKSIPVGAGLGGGSADAAAALKLLNGIARRMSRSELVSLGGTIGSDVPYCLTGGFAFCEGIGDEIQPVTTHFQCPLLILNSGIHADTARAYRALGRDGKNPAGGDESAEIKNAIRSALDSGMPRRLKALLVNDFEAPVFGNYPELREMRDALYDAGAAVALMTGSGSSVIGLFDDLKEARRAEKNFGEKITMSFLTDFIVE